MKKIKPSIRRKTRSLALQAIYQWQLTTESEDNIKKQFNNKKIDSKYFHNLLNGIITNAKIIDEIITPYLDRKLDALDFVELAVLRLATYELKYQLEVPYKVIINEALELTKIFGSSEGYKYINGVLDKIAHNLR
ncbi:MAG: transcription antitermination factor NusB [Coxiellaceae bacterium]|jgi:N utilization substance protein B|nr:transcription antitermination factor NusB [Coxiellaceae bacterium]